MLPLASANVFLSIENDNAFKKSSLLINGFTLYVEPPFGLVPFLPNIDSHSSAVVELIFNLNVESP